MTHLQVATLQLPPDRKTKREQLAAQKEQHGKVSRTKSLKMKILGSNEELTVEEFNPNPLGSGPATAPVVGEHNPLDAAVASTSGASPPQFVAQVIHWLNDLTCESLLRPQLIESL